MIKLKVADEARIATCFASLVAEFPDVAAGSYPSTSGQHNCTLSISLEGKDPAQVDAAVQRFRELLDDLPDADLDAALAIDDVQSDVYRFGPSHRASREELRPG